MLKLGFDGGMRDLNQASFDDLVRAGVAAELAAQVALWRPYRAWSELDGLPGFDDLAMGCLRGAGYGIVPPDETLWRAPQPFRVTAGD